MESICTELGISPHHVRETSVPDRFLIITDKGWLQSLEQKKKLTEFPIYHGLDKRIHPTVLAHPWTKVHVQIYRKQNEKVFPLPKNRDVATCNGEGDVKELPMTYSQAVSYVTNTNFRNLWEAAYKKYSASHLKLTKQTNQSVGGRRRDCPFLPYDIVLRELIQRIFNCSIIFSNGQPQHEPSVSTLTSSDCHTNVLPALAAIETCSHIAVVFYPSAIETSLYDCITYSPAILSKSHNKSLFIIYQLLQLTKHLSKLGLFLGDIRLHDILVKDNLWLQIIPRIESNIIQQDLDDVSPSTDNPVEDDDEEEYSTSTKLDLKFAYDLEQFTLREYCEMWCNGQLSNFDYLTILNNAAGRSVSNPEYHHIMPWVTDFFHRSGSNWRDLSKSKYRLNKGDIHLDLMFASHGATSHDVPHHVSDFLSEITYFVYMARRTPQHILCHHVRPIWVPAEYPVSIQRLQEWTPDECIPEFYSDPMVFKSIHEDLPDLELPAWASCPEDFIAKHREALESQHVSERLQLWIDLNFGYKLTGKAAIKSKNVCLSMVDNHKNMCQRGIVQLFTHAHPPKRFPSPWFYRKPPRLSTASELSRRLAKSTDDVSSSIRSPLRETDSSLLQTTPQKFGRLSPKSTRQPNTIIEDNSQLIESSTSNFYPTTNFIELPKDYSPLALLQSLETMETFFSKTFLGQKVNQNHTEKMAHNDLLFEESENSFTNQLFADNYAQVEPQSKNGDCRLKAKSFIAAPPTSKRNLKQILSEKREKDLQIIGCLIIELFAVNKLRPLLMSGMNSNFEERLKACRLVAKSHASDIPKCLRYVVDLLLNLNRAGLITEQGLPSPTAHQLLEPIFAHNLIPFPNTYFPIYTLIRTLRNFEFNSTLLDLYTHINCDGKECSKYTEIDRKRVLFTRKIAECKVKSCCVQIENLLEPIAYEQFGSVELLLPHVIDLLQNDETSILTAWYLFDVIATALGIRETQKYLLDPIMKLYDIESYDRASLSARKTTDGGINSIRFTTSSSFKSRKSVKLYHHSFLLRLIVRFGLKCFLDNFIAPLIEAVGGYKEPEDSTGFHFHSNTNSRQSRCGKNLKFACNDESENSLTLISPEADATLSFDASTKQEIEDVFSFDDDNSDKSSNVVDPENKSVDSFDIRPSNAEEATEDAPIYTPEKIAINEIIYGHQRLSNASFEEDKISITSQTDSPLRESASVMGPKSPTIAIPSTFRRSYQLNSIDCEIGSKVSVDSFELVEEKNKSEPNDSLQASVISKISEAKSVQNNRISEMSSESLIWLSHRLGPVLTARYLTKNLLKMLSLCYVGQENLLPENYDSEECGNLNYFSTSDAKVIGDRSAARVLECLTSIAALFGEEFILLQYFPHISELVSLCQKRITPSLEGALISSLQLLKFLVPCLVESTIMERLKDVILDTMLIPIIRLLGSTRCLMPSSFLGRSVLARKLLDAIYVLSVRIGPDMSKEHLCIPALRKFFLIFDKAYGISENFRDCSEDVGVSPPNYMVGGNEDAGDFQNHQKENEEIRDVFSPNLAHCSYLAFLRFLGESIMTKTVINLEFILTLCHEFEQPNYASPNRTFADNTPESSRRGSVEEHATANSFGTTLIGNRIEVATTTTRQEMGPMEVLDMVAYKFDQIGKTRHLRGNWLAYWRHEISRPDKDSHLSLKQIKLQTFAGHTNSVRAMVALDNENSFMSASKDKTVKLWSLRSEGDGKKVSSCQFTYNSHKKPVHSLAFLEAMRFVVSCDSGVHMWDPFIGRPLGILDSPKHNPVTVVRCYPSPSPLIVAGTAESSVKIIDSRTMQYVNEWRLSSNLNGTVRCLAVAPSGNWVAAGLSSGVITLLDARTGILMSSWRPMECDMLQLAAASDSQIISSALDHSIAVWNVNDSSLQYQFKPPPEPAHCLQPIGPDLVFATTANRIGIYSDIGNHDGTSSVTKLRSETLRGVLTSLAVLPLNRTFLAGNESGNIVLLC